MSQEVHIDVVVLGLAAVWVVGFGTAAARLARARHRAVAVWAVLGAVIGPAALLLLRRAPMGRCPVCEAPVRGWSPICAWCGSDTLHVAPATRDLVAAVDRAPMPRPVAPPPRPITAPPSIPADPTSAPSGGATAPDPAVTEPARTTRTRRAPNKATTAAAGSKATTGSTPAGAKPTQAGAKSASRRSTTSTTGPKPAAAGTKPAAKRPSRAKAPLALVPDVPQPVTTTLASAVFVTGSVGLQPGSWYTLEREGDNLRVLGPVDRDARAVALTRPLAPLEASAFNGRLIVNGDDGLVMVFMRVAGMPAEAIAESIEAVGRGIASAG